MASEELEAKLVNQSRQNKVLEDQVTSDLVRSILRDAQKLSEICRHSHILYLLFWNVEFLSWAAFVCWCCYALVTDAHTTFCRRD